MKAHNFVLSCLIGLASSLGTAADPPAPAASPAPPATESKPPLKVPSEYKRKIVQGQVMYCTKTTTLGSRFPKTLCIDEAGLRAMIEQRQSNQDDLRRSQSLCASAGACSVN